MDKKSWETLEAAEMVRKLDELLSAGRLNQAAYDLYKQRYAGDSAGQPLTTNHNALLVRNKTVRGVADNEEMLSAPQTVVSHSQSGYRGTRALHFVNAVAGLIVVIVRFGFRLLSGALAFVLLVILTISKRGRRRGRRSWWGFDL